MPPWSPCRSSILASGSLDPDRARAAHELANRRGPRCRSDRPEPVRSRERELDVAIEGRAGARRVEAVLVVVRRELAMDRGEKAEPPRSGGIGRRGLVEPRAEDPHRPP